jgi:hypothetical protein
MAGLRLSGREVDRQLQFQLLAHACWLLSDMYLQSRSPATHQKGVAERRGSTAKRAASAPSRASSSRTQDLGYESDQVHATAVMSDESSYPAPA